MRCGKAVILVEYEEANTVGVEGFPVEMSDIRHLDVRHHKGGSEDDREYGYDTGEVAHDEVLAPLQKVAVESGTRR